MAKFKAPKAKKPAAPSNLKALPCVVLVLIVFALVMMLLYFGLKSSS